MQLTVGTEVEIEVDTSFVHRYLVGEAKHTVPPVSRISGTVAPTPAWFPEHVAVLNSRTGAISLVARRTILRVNNVAYTQPKTASNDRTWTVPSSKGKGTYKVTYTAGTGHFNCSCSGWQFRRACKHVTDAKKQLEAA